MTTKSLKIVKSMGAGLLIAATMLTSNVFAEEQPQKGDVGRGAVAWVDNCVRCHDARDPKELRDDQWITTAYHMRIRAGFTGQQVRDVIAFLQMSN